MFEKIRLPRSWQDIDGFSLDIYKKNTGKIFGFNIESTGYCCGLLEIGNIFHYVEGFDVDILVKELAKVLQKLCKKGTFISKKTGIIKKYQFMCNLIDTPACNILKKAIIFSGEFYKVTEFKNLNSGNTIEVWFSK